MVKKKLRLSLIRPEIDPYVNGGLRGVVQMRGDQIEQPRDQPIRPGQSPLPGAEFHRSGDTFKLTYEVDGRWSLGATEFLLLVTAGTICLIFVAFWLVIQQHKAQQSDQGMAHCDILPWEHGGTGPETCCQQVIDHHKERKSVATPNKKTKQQANAPAKEKSTIAIRTDNVVKKKHAPRCAWPIDAQQAAHAAKVIMVRSSPSVHLVSDTSGIEYGSFKTCSQQEEP